jgi:endonuclease YncB( thermonuclease family)
MGMVDMAHPSYPHICATDKSEFEGFAFRSYSRKTGNAHFTLRISIWRSSRGDDDKVLAAGVTGGDEGFVEWDSALLRRFT